MRIRPWVPVSRLPATTLYVMVLAATAAWLAAQSPHKQERFIRHNSSNVHHLEGGEWWTLLTSSLVVDGVPVLLGIGAVAAALGRAEWRWGSARGLSVFFFGHVAATLLTQGVVWLMRLAHMPGALARMKDVGISYGLVATVACLLALGGERARRYGLPALAVILAVAWTVNQELADAGHLVALGLGVLASRTRWLRDGPAGRSSSRPADSGACNAFVERSRSG
ncbi:rhomboid-like protein [Streptomyces sp. WAC 06725]|uniref:rhomboid-like protein n=1 Tax=Streptomyces sp. WAC 06725 TaxID=2203209 RepID=UPI0026B96EA0|nr:rhomboid-like protein [Streptomyces sp. WAC 06725]